MNIEISQGAYDFAFKVGAIAWCIIGVISVLFLLVLLSHWIDSLIYIFENKKMGELNKLTFYKTGLVESVEKTEDAKDDIQ